jgi:uncharacterized membrane protein
MLPYKDFFEHHTPWYPYALSPFFSLFDVDRSFTSAVHFLLLGRGLSFVLAGVSVSLLCAMGRRWEDRRVGLVAGLLFVSQPVFLMKTLEMRPDVPALALFLGSLWLLIRGIRGRADGTDRLPSRFLAAGLSLGAAIMCTQKMLFVLPGILAGLAIFSVFANSESPFEAGLGGVRARLLSSAAFVMGVCVPGVVTWAVFASRHAGRAFITNNFLLNARWKHFATHRLIKLVDTSWPVLALALLGAALCVSQVFRAGGARRRYDGLLLLSTAVGLFLGVLIMPVPHLQYYLMPLPIVCLFAAKGLLGLVDGVRARWRVTLVGAMALGLAILPVRAFWQAFRDRNDGQLAKLRYVFEQTQPADVVMDGWAGMGVFRPHAFYYFFLHEETIAMLPRAALETYLDALDSGKLRPKLIAVDKNLATLGPRFLLFVKNHYITNDGFFYLAR